MTVAQLLAQLRTEMTGEPARDMQHLANVAEDLKKEENAGELIAAVAEFAYEAMPEEQRAEMEARTFVLGKRMDMAYGEVLQLIRENKAAEAEPILEAISDKITEYFEGSDPKYFSFRNPFEYHMYREFYPNDREFDRAPFDFADYLSLYGYVLIEVGKIGKAGEVLERAIRFNPVSADVRFEMAELCKLAHDNKKLLAVNQDTLRLCTSADRIARVLANMGYYCCEQNDFYEAAVFYFESLRFQSSKAVEAELQDVLRRMKTFGQKFTPPTHGQTIDTYEKYGLQPPPNSDLVNLAAALAHTAHDMNRIDLEGLFTRIAFDLTNDPAFKEALTRIDAQIAAEKKASQTN